MVQIDVAEDENRAEGLAALEERSNGSAGVEQLEKGVSERVCRLARWFVVVGSSVDEEKGSTHVGDGPARHPVRPAAIGGRRAQG